MIQNLPFPKNSDLSMDNPQVLHKEFSMYTRCNTFEILGLYTWAYILAAIPVNVQVIHAYPCHIKQHFEALYIHESRVRS